MSLATTRSQQVYNGDGARTVFPTVFSFGANGDLVVEVAPAGGAYAAKVLGVDYTLTGAGAAEPGGNVTFISGAPANLSTVRITRNTPRTQPTSFPTQGEFLPAVHEAAFDREERQVQELERRLTAVEIGAIGISIAQFGAVAQKVQSTFVVADPPEGSFPFNVAVAAMTPTGVQLVRVEDLTDGAAVQSVGIPDISAMVANQFTVRNVPGLIPGHQYRLTWQVSNL